MYSLAQNFKTLNYRSSHLYVAYISFTFLSNVGFQHIFATQLYLLQVSLFHSYSYDPFKQEFFFIHIHLYIIVDGLNKKRRLTNIVKKNFDTRRQTL
jgi:hypothetical protein